MQITEQWIGKTAGWKMLKAGRALWKNGSVKESSYDPSSGLVVGVIGGGEQPKQVKLHILSEIEIENKCSCFWTRRTGELCEHAVAVLLHVANGEPAQKEWAKPKKELEKPSFEPVAIRVELPPQFPDGIEKGLTLRLLQQEVEPSQADLQLCLWLHQIGLKEIPPMLALRSKDAVGFLTALEHHNSVFAEERQIRCIGSSIKLPVSTELEEDRVGFRLLKNKEVQFSYLPSMITCWDGTQRLFATPRKGELTSTQQERLVAGGSIYIPVKSFLKHLSQWESVFDWGDSQLLASLRVIPAYAEIEVSIDGSIQKIQIQVEARYPGGIKVKLGEANHDDVFPIQDKNHQGRWLIRNSRKEKEALAQIHKAGFVEDKNGWVLEGEDAVLNFLSSDLPEWQKTCNVTEGNRLKSLRNNIVRVKPSIDFEGAGEDWLAFDYGFQTDDGKQIPKEMIERMLKAGKRTATTKNGKRVVISAFDSEMLEHVLKDVDPRQEAGKYYVSSYQAAYLNRVRSYYGKLEKMPSESCIKQLPDSIQKTLRTYQEEGIAWLHQRITQEGSALLADDMGLGKTLQTLSLVYLLKQKHHQPALVVCPTSLLVNWSEEIVKFFPQLSSVVFHGAGRKELMSNKVSHDVIITSYALVARDIDYYAHLDLSCVIIDEASIIRNPDTQVAKALRQVQAKHRIALTGTPVENALQDLWSIFEWMMPKYLGSREDFKRRYVKPCSGSQPDKDVLKRLRLRVEPFLLRRTKREVATDLPAKMEQIVWCDMSETQQGLYKKLMENGVQLVSEAAKKSKGQAKMQMLTTLLRLRQSCCDVRLLDDAIFEEKLDQVSVKLVRLLELVREAKAGGHRMLIFSQFTSMLKLIKQALDEQDVTYSYLGGSTRDRGKEVRDFQKSTGSDVFLISLKAGGYGLNLTVADMVVHFDPWWNPAVEAQATDRAYRIGQTKPVNVYKFITRGTVEEKIIKLQEKKRGLIGATVDEEALMSGLTASEIESLLD